MGAAALQFGLGAAQILGLYLGESVSKATEELNKSLEGFDKAVTQEMRGFVQLNRALLKLDREINLLCADLQAWAAQCCCACSGSNTQPNFNFLLPVSISPSSGGGGAGPGEVPPPQSGSLPNVKVEVHNYGPKTSPSNPQNRKALANYLAEQMAHDVRAGGPLGRAVSQVYGIPRTPIKR